MPSFWHRSITGFCPTAVIMITLVFMPIFLRLLRTVSPLMSGRIMSRRIRSGLCFLVVSNACSPFSASSISVSPMLDSFSFSSIRMKPESSTISIFFVFASSYYLFSNNGQKEPLGCSKYEKVSSSNMCFRLCNKVTLQ